MNEQTQEEPTCTCCGQSATTDEERCLYHTDPDIEPEEDPNEEFHRMNSNYLKGLGEK